VKGLILFEGHLFIKPMLIPYVQHGKEGAKFEVTACSKVGNVIGSRSDQMFSNMIQKCY
jgi:hypothetical protein